jgi:tetratricopeptide (TPR) repeat protein
MRLFDPMMPSNIRSVILAMAIAPTVWAQTGGPGSPADSLFQKGDWRGTAQAYAAITQREPSNGMAWFRLGVARQSQSEYDAAIPAFEKARDLKFQVLAADFRLARIYSLKKDTDRAIQALDRVVQAGLANPTQLAAQRDLDNVRDDPRFKMILANVERVRFPCRAGTEATQFDFWVGRWDVFPWTPGGSLGTAQVGTNDVESILEHCVLQENWTGTGGGSGKSMNFYDTNVNKWRQIWVADGGGSLDYTGEFRDGAMRFAGWTRGPNGGKVLQKLTFFAIARDTVRQLFESSQDSGKTWQPGFDGKYVRRKP